MEGNLGCTSHPWWEKKKKKRPNNHQTKPTAPFPWSWVERPVAGASGLASKQLSVGSYGNLHKYKLVA